MKAIVDMSFNDELNAIYDVTTGGRCYYLSVRLLIYPLSTRLVYFSNRLKLHPNHLSMICAFFSVVCLYALFIGNYLNAFIFYYTRVVFDYADGALARYSRKTSPMGKVLERIIDEPFFLLTWILLAWHMHSMALRIYFLCSVLLYRYIVDLYIEPKFPLLARRAPVKKFFLDRGIVIGCGVFGVMEFWTILILACGLAPLILVPTILCNMDLMYRFYEIERYRTR